MRTAVPALVLLAACLAPVPEILADSHAAQRPARVISSLIQRAAIVEAVNPETRELKLIDATGHRFSIVADEVVRNFDQIEARDRIVVEYLESVAVVVAPHGAPKPVVGDAMAVAIAEAGDKPAFENIETHLVTGTVESINTSERRATVSLETGEVRTLKVGPQARLDLVEVGDQLRLRITRAVALSVVKPDT